MPKGGVNHRCLVHSADLSDFKQAKKQLVVSEIQKTGPLIIDLPKGVDLILPLPR